MSNLNMVALQGRIVHTPEIRGDENKVAKFDLAVNHGFGEKKTVTFVSCVAFGKQVATIEQYFTKGKEIIIEGRLFQNRWENKEGQKRSKLEVHVERFSFVSGQQQTKNET